jgi:hypothetical protein
MQFLAPLFLVALAGLAIPVLLHLTQREKKQIIRFPSLMFVRRIPYQSVRRRKIQNWLLLLVRMTALALLIAAFARPFIMRSDAIAPPGAGARELVVLLDTSYSMGYGERWEAARQAAHDAFSSLNSSDRGSLVLFSSGAEIAIRSAAERERLTAAVATARPGAGGTRYAPAIKVAGSILADSLLPRREVILISDFQRNGWRGEEGARLPQGAMLTPVPIQGATDRPNVSVTAVSLARSTFSNQERVTVTAGLANRSDAPVRGTPVTLQVATGTSGGSIPVTSRTVDLEPGGTTSVTFDPFTVSGRNMRGTVTLGGDALEADNAYHFVVSPSETLRVTLVDRGAEESRRYLADALAIGDTPRIEPVVRGPESLSDDDLKRSAVVVVNDVAVPTGAARRIGQFVEGGGGLFVVAGTRASWPGDVDVLPGTFGLPIDRTRGEPSRVGLIEYGHPVFEPFRLPRSGNFSAARVFNYRQVSALPSAQVLARFDGGSPAMLERRVGTGRVLLWASALDQPSSELPLKPLFPVFVQQAVRYLGAYREPRPWLAVGQVLDPEAAAAPKSAPGSRVVLTPSSRRVPLEDEGAEVLELTERGFYEIRDAADASNLTVVAANVDAAEGDLTPIDPSEIATAAMGTPGASGERAAAGVPLTPEAQENNQRLWWYLLCAGIALLAVDTILSNRLAKT